MDAAAAATRPIVYFDGVCGLCNGFVDHLIRLDRNRKLRYAMLQGRTAQQQLPADHTEVLNSIVYFDGERLLTRSEAALHIVMKLGGAWKLAGIFLLLPRFLRDGVYNWIARNRYQWFGKRGACRLPSPEERALFLP